MTFEEMDQVLSVLVTHAEATDRRLDRVADNQLFIQQDIQLLTSRLNTLTVTVAELSQTVRDQGEQAERDRNQANLDRASFQTSIQDILNYLRTRYNGNRND
ncbi:MAG: hypothetical protein HC866_11655 [Leptolyngbyaceae cyanobacterium RU_5_1]|nr:hypothetical protein [Leptolyngbyaceae cyanobacterium RU_5_1]